MIGAAALLLVPEIVAPPRDTRLWQELFNAGHVPLFGVLSLVLLGLARALLPRVDRTAWLPYLIAFAGSLIIGATAELLQIVGPRDSDPVDLLRDATGALAFLGVRATLDGRLSTGLAGRGRWVVPCIRLASVLLLGATFLPVVWWGWAYVGRDRAFPVLCDFGSAWSRGFVDARGVRLQSSGPPASWRTLDEQRVGKLEFSASGYAYPGVGLDEPYPDWSAHRSLKFRVFSENPEPLPLHLRINDREHDQRYADRFNREVRILPGANQFVIPLSEVRDAPATREMDMTQIRQVILFADHPAKPFTIYLEGFWLE